MSPEVGLPELIGRGPRLSERGCWRVAGYGAFTLAAVLVAYWRVYSSFPSYDDEGYVLLSLREFLRTGDLYSKVYSQYGPFPYELWGAVYRITGAAVTPDSARVIVIVLWVGGSLLAGIAVEQVCRSLTTGLIVVIATFAALGEIVNEVLIPDDLTTVLAIALMAVAALGHRRPRAQMASIGVLVAALILTKINIGGAILLACCLAVAGGSPQLRHRPWTTWIFAGLGALVPILLIRPDLAKPWAENLTLLIALSAVALGAVATRTRSTVRDQTDPPLDWPWFVGGVLAGLLVLCGIITVTGTSPSELVHGVLIAPLGQRQAFSIAATTPAVAVDIAIAGVVGAVLTRREIARSLGPLGAGSLRVLLGVLIVLWASSTLPFVPNPDPSALGVALPVAWVGLLAPTVIDDPHRVARLVIAAVPVFAAVGIYPVAGSQVGYATALCVPVGGVILADGVALLRSWYRVRSAQSRSPLLPAARMAGLGLAAVLGYQLLLQSGVASANAYASSQPLAISGAQRLRLPASTATAYTDLTDTLQRRCAQFVTYPGMNSFYLWAHQVPPTGLNVTAWMFLLDDAQQTRIVDAVARVRHLCLVTNPAVLAGWTGSRTPPARPLERFVTDREWTPIYTADGYTISLRRA